MKKLVYAILIAAVSLAFSGKTIMQSTIVSDVADGKLHVFYLDVAQADSALIILPDGKSMLIDAGNKEDGDKIVKTIQNLGLDTVDYLIATHPHADHIGGMEQVVRAFDIGEIYMTNAQTNTKTFENLLLAIKEKDEKIIRAKAGVEIFSDENICAYFVAPNADSYDDLNNYSAVMKLTYGENSFLFTGDAEKISEDQIRSNIKCDVLKVGHHGSSSSTTKNFLKKTEPTYAVVSCGKDNSYGHPDNEVIKRLEVQKINIYRTDTNGTVEAVSDGKTITFNTER